MSKEIKVGNEVDLVSKVGDSQKRYIYKCKCGCLFERNANNARRSKVNNGDNICNKCSRQRHARLQTKYNSIERALIKLHRSIKNRCKASGRSYSIGYGDSGILVCDEWSCVDGFKNFYEWSINNGYKRGLSIDRINPNGNYSPDNCRFIEMRMQHHNKKDTLFTYHDGFYYPTKMLSNYIGFNCQSFTNINKKTGVSIEEYLTRKGIGYRLYKSMNDSNIIAMRKSTKLDGSPFGKLLTPSDNISNTN